MMKASTDCADNVVKLKDVDMSIFYPKS